MLERPYQKAPLSLIKELVKKKIDAGPSKLKEMNYLNEASLQAIEGASSIQQLCAQLIGLGEVCNVEEAITFMNKLVEDHFLSVAVKHSGPQVGVSNVKDFLKKWGTSSPSVLVAEFIRLSPDFPRGGELAKVLGELMGDLETALEDAAKS